MEGESFEMMQTHDESGAVKPPPSQSEPSNNEPFPQSVNSEAIKDDRNEEAKPQVEERPEKQTSPEPNCAICLGKMENKSFTDSCFHQFCFTCLLEWSKVKAECPLCKQSFKSIVHNVRSIEDYDQYHLQHTTTQGDYGSWDGTEGGRRFRYRSTLTAERRRELALGRLLLGHGRRNHSFGSWSPPGPSSSASLSSSSSLRPSFVYTTSEFRRYIYDNNLWARASCRASRYREAAPNFYASNPAVTHRLVPWLNRELNALRYGHQVAFLLELIMSLIHRFHIRSPEFLEHIRPYFLDNADHFVHEFFHFARSPHDMVEYDRMVMYAPGGTGSVDGMTNLPSSSDNEVVVLYANEGASLSRRLAEGNPSVLSRARDFLRLVSASSPPLRGYSSRGSSSVRPTSPSFSTQLRRSVSPIPGPSGLRRSTINASIKPEVTLDDEEDDDDCMIIAVKKPPLQYSATEVIDLSDDDELVSEEPCTSRVAGNTSPTSPQRSRSSDSSIRERSKSPSSSESDYNPPNDSSTSKSKRGSKSHKKHHKKHRHHSSNKKRRSRSPSRHRHTRSRHHRKSSSSDRSRNERQKRHNRKSTRLHSE